MADPPCTGHFASQWSHDWTGEMFKDALGLAIKNLRRPRRAVIIDNGKDQMMSAHELTVLTEADLAEDPPDVCAMINDTVVEVCGEAVLCVENPECRRARRRGFATPPGSRIYQGDVVTIFTQHFQDRPDNHGFVALSWLP
ncbi:hypothetical protein [Actinoplanes awajinensis]|nr:hypothetical protein [Actinoplanes awajinensis]